MDFQSSKNLWGKSSGNSSGNLYENCCNLWRVQSPSPVANGHSFGSSSGMNSSSQSSSRENSPIYLHKNDLHRIPYRANLSNLTMNNGYRSQSSDSLQISAPWSENDTWNTNQYSEQPQGFSSATVDSSQEGQTPVELLITNLAQNIDSREMKKILFSWFRELVMIEEKDNESKVTLIDRSIVNELWAKSRKILWDEPKCSLPVKKFVERFTQVYNHPPNLEVIGKDLQEFVQIQRDSDSREISLVPVQVFARDLLILLNEAGGRMLLINFESSYLNRFGVACRPANLGFHNLTALVQSLGDLASIKGRKAKRIIVLNREQVPELPSYCPPVQVQSQTEAKEKSKINNLSTTYNPVPPPPLSFPQSKVPPPPPPPPPTPPCEQKHYSKDLPGSHLIMGLTPPPPPQQTYQAPSPVIYSGSPVAPNGSVVWGQVWSPQYSVIPPLSSTHYMMPTVPINWSSMPSPPLFSQSKSDENVHHGKAPVSIKTLEQFGKLGVPPNPSELPSPELLTNKGGLGEGSFNFEENAISTLSTCEDDENHNLAKAYAKKRLAAHFDSRE